MVTTHSLSRQRVKHMLGPGQADSASVCPVFKHAKCHPGVWWIVQVQRCVEADQRGAFTINSAAPLYLTDHASQYVGLRCFSKIACGHSDGFFAPADVRR